MQTKLIIILFIFSTTLMGQTPCDTLLLISGDHILVKHIYYDGDEMIYERCEKNDGTTYAISRNKVAAVHKMAKIKTQKTITNRLLESLRFNSGENSTLRKKTTTTFKGSLKELKDSSVVILINSEKKEFKELEVTEIKKIYYKDPDRLKKNQRLYGIIGGALGGLTGLFYNSLNQFSSFYGGESSSSNAAGSFIIGALVGGGIGFAIGSLEGSIKVSIPIYGKQDNYKKAIKQNDFHQKAMLTILKYQEVE